MASWVVERNMFTNLQHSEIHHGCEKFLLQTLSWKLEPERGDVPTKRFTACQLEYIRLFLNIEGKI